MRSRLLVVAAAAVVPVLASAAGAGCTETTIVQQVAPADGGGSDAPVVVPTPATDGGDDGGGDGGTVASKGKNISSASNSAYEAEDQIAVAPDGTIGIAWTELSTQSLKIGYRFSTDDGATFSPIQYLPLPAGLYGGDPAITVDASGNFYAAFLGLHPSGQSVDYARVYVAKAAKGSTSFAAPVEASDAAATVFYDHPKISVTAGGTIVVTVMRSDTIDSTSTFAGIAATSTDGTSWSRHTIVDDGGGTIAFANLYSMCEGSGALYVTYLEASNTAMSVVLRKSTDDGTTWSTTSTPVSLAGETPSGLDPMCVASGNDVWVAYGTSKTLASGETKLDPADGIRVAHSSDGGASFGTGRVDALDVSATKLGCLPLVERESDGALDVVYLGGASDGDDQGSVRYTRAAAGATSFGASASIDEPLVFDMSRDTPTWLGDYFGAAVHGHALYVAYPMNASGRSHVFFEKLALP